MSPPTSIVRMVIGRPPSAWAITAYCRSCSSTPGARVAVEEEELGPDEPGTVGAGRGGGPGVRDRAQVRRHVDAAPPSPVTAARARRRPCRAPVAPPAGRSPRRYRSRTSVHRVHEHEPGRSVDDQRRSVGDVEDRRTRRHDGGDAERADEDARVRGGAAAGEHHGPDVPRIQGRGLRRVRSGATRTPSTASDGDGRLAGERTQHLVGHGTDVGGAGAQVGVGQRRPLLLDRGGGRRPCGGGRLAVVDARAAPRPRVRRRRAA